MTLYEILTLLVAAIGAITGVTSLVRTRVIETKQLEFQAVAAALAKRQLKALEKEQSARDKSDVIVDLVKVGRSDFRFVLSNRGGATALNVNFRVAADSPDDPLVQNECDRKLPYPKLEAGQSFTLIAALHMGSAMRYPTHVSWQNADGSTEAREIYVAV